MSKSVRAGLFLISFGLLFISGILIFIQKSLFNTVCSDPAEGSSVDAFAIGSDWHDEIARIEKILSVPVELGLDESLIQVSPERFGQTMNTEQVRSELSTALSRQCSDRNFIRFLFGQFKQEPVEQSLACSCDPALIESYLNEQVAPRYSQQPLPIQPKLTGKSFLAGQDGLELDTAAAVSAIAAAVCSPSGRKVELSLKSIPQPEPSLVNLRLMLQNIIDITQDSGQLTEIYFHDFRSNETMNFARRNHENFPPEIAFTAASTIKLPVLISSFIRLDQGPSAIITRQMELMITESKNDQTDWLMNNVIDGTAAPLSVTDDVRQLGLENTFLAGYFYLQAPLLDLIQTPANQRTDSGMKPDIYNQTTPKDMGELMKMLYECDSLGSGLLLETFPGRITSHECHLMTNLLKDNHLPYLITAGLPEQTPIAHKHGWTEESDGLLHTMSNVAAVYTPNGDYILTVFTNHPVNLIFEKGNILFSSISAAVYSYFNPDPRAE